MYIVITLSILLPYLPVGCIFTYEIGGWCVILDSAGLLFLSTAPGAPSNAAQTIVMCVS